MCVKFDKISFHCICCISKSTAVVCPLNLYESEGKIESFYLSEVIGILQINCCYKLFSDVLKCNFNIKAVLNYSEVSRRPILYGISLKGAELRARIVRGHLYSKI